MPEKTVNINVRFPESIRDRVKAFASRDRRSMNSEILALLEEAMDAREPQRRPQTADYRYPVPSEHQATGRLLRAADRRPDRPT